MVYKGKINPFVAGINAFSLLQHFDTVGWMTPKPKSWFNSNKIYTAPVFSLGPQSEAIKVKVSPKHSQMCL